MRRTLGNFLRGLVERKLRRCSAPSTRNRTRSVIMRRVGRVVHIRLGHGFRCRTELVMARAGRLAAVLRKHRASSFTLGYWAMPEIISRISDVAVVAFHVERRRLAEGPAHPSILDGLAASLGLQWLDGNGLHLHQPH